MRASTHWRHWISQSYTHTPFKINIARLLKVAILKLAFMSEQERRKVPLRGLSCFWELVCLWDCLNFDNILLTLPPNIWSQFQLIKNFSWAQLNLFNLSGAIFLYLECKAHVQIFIINITQIDCH